MIKHRLLRRRPRKAAQGGSGRNVDVFNVTYVKAFDKRSKEPTRSFEQVLKDLKRDGLL